MRWLLSFLTIGLVSLVQALSSQGTRLLVVLDDLADKTNYSQLWIDLEARGFSITYETAKSTSVDLFKHGALAYEHTLFLSTKAKSFGPKLTANVLVQYMNTGGNLLLGLSGKSSTAASLASFLLEFDISLPVDRSSIVVDHFDYDTTSASDKHDVLVLPAPSATRSDIQDYFGFQGTLAVPRAVGQVLGNANPLLFPILRAPDTAYSCDVREGETQMDDLFATGSQLSLVTAFQARNSARMTVLGSTEMLQDAFFQATVQTPSGETTKTANRVFAEKLTMWTFQEIGVLKVGRIEHGLQESSLSNAGNATSGIDSEANPEIYRIKSDVTCSIELSEYKIDRLVPFSPPGADKVQLEFSMLSPFHRLNLIPESQSTNSTIYSTSFKLPDQHGIFNFLVNYKRPLMTNVFEKRTVTVRHFAHDEWPRSYVISAAHPWIAGIAVTVVGWIAFCAVWLYSRPVEEESRGKKIQ